MIISGCEYIARSSVSSSGAQADGFSDRPSVSSDGRYLAFHSAATNLVPDDTNEIPDVFVRDHQTGTTERVSVSTAGEEADGESYDPRISDNGQFVVFESFASNLVDDDTNSAPDIFVHDRTTGTTERVSVDSDGDETTDGASQPAISGDGLVVGFISTEPDLVEGDTNGTFDVFVHDRTSGSTERLSVATGATEADSGSFGPRLNGDGEVVSFVSFATNLVSNDDNDLVDVFVRDRSASTTERVSVGDGEEEADGGSTGGGLSGDGRFVVFSSGATNLVPDDTNGASDVFVRDRTSGTTERVSLANLGGQAAGSGSSFGGSISTDGRYVAFDSSAVRLGRR